LTTPTEPHPHARRADQDAGRAATLLAVAGLTAAGQTQPTAMQVSAVLYLAERLHLSHYGALMFGGRYRALPGGPLCDAAVQLVRAQRSEPRLTDHEASWMPVEAAPPDDGDLSVSVRRSIGETLAATRPHTAEHLMHLCQDRAWRAAQDLGAAISAEMIAADLDNAAALLDHLADPYL